MLDSADVTLRVRWPEPLRLVPLHAGLLTAFHEAILESGPDLARWMTWWHPGFELHESEQFVSFCEQGWTGGTHFELAVQTDSCAYVGSCALTSVARDARSANLAYWTRSSCSGRGIATSAARAVAAWGVSSLGLERIEVAMATANIASRRVAERAGAVFEGVLRNRVRVGGRSYNFAIYSFSPADFHADELQPDNGGQS